MNLHTIGQLVFAANQESNNSKLIFLVSCLKGWLKTSVITVKKYLYYISGRPRPLPIKWLRVECEEEAYSSYKLQNVLVCVKLEKNMEHETGLCVSQTRENLSKLNLFIPQ